MAVETDEDLAVFFDPAEFGELVDFTPSGGATVSDIAVQVFRNQEGLEPGRGVVSALTILHVPVFSIAAINRGDAFTIGGAAFEVDQKPTTDESDKVWRVGVHEV